MSRYLVTATFIALSFVLLMGCAPGAPAVYTDDKAPISSSLGEPFIIALPSNPTTGFSWQMDYDRTILTLTGKDYVQDPSAGGRVGAGGTEKFTFQGVRTGNTKITLKYQRPWESIPPAETRVFNVTIK